MVSLNRLSSTSKLYLTLIVYSVAMLVVFGIFQHHRERMYKINELEAELQMVNDHILDELENKKAPLGEELAGPYPFKDMRITIYRKDGTALFDNFNNKDSINDAMRHREIRQALEEGEGWSMRHSRHGGKDYFYAAQTSPNYIIRTGLPDSEWLQDTLGVDYSYFALLAAMTGGMIVIGFFLSSRAARNLAMLSEFADRLERGEEFIPDYSFPSDEIGKISGNIVRLCAKARHEHSEALRMEHEKNRLKRQMTADISHELKTPVASMEICLSALMEYPDMDSEKRSDFIRRCYLSNKRLQKLMENVSQLTRMDDAPATPLGKEPLNLRLLVADVCDEYSEVCLARGILISNSLSFDGPFRGNRGLVATVFRNIIDNAISYSGCSEIAIDEISSAGDAVLIAVSDNGKGVPPEVLPNLFDRFYRVDKGRSRAMGGSSLGLAIVKSAVEFHGGNITALINDRCGLTIQFSLMKG